MRSTILLAAALGALAATPAAAQMDPAQVGLGMVMPSAINAQAKQQREKQALSEKNRRTCADMPGFRRDYPGDPRIATLEGFCRKLGYPIGR